MKQTISAIIITRNEEDQLEACLKTLSFADQVLIVDNGSEDFTLKIAKQHNIPYWIVPILDFAYLRNVGKEKAAGQWLLYIDADERVTPALQKEILSVTSSGNSVSSYSMVRMNYFFNRLWPHRDVMTRLMRKDALIGWKGALHETPVIAGKTSRLRHPLLHYTHDDLTTMVEKTNEWSQIEAQLRYKNGHPRVTWWRLCRVAATGFWTSFISQKGYRAGTAGWVESMYQGFSMFVTYAKLWEKQNRSRMKIPPVSSPSQPAPLTGFHSRGKHLS